MYKIFTIQIMQYVKSEHETIGFVECKSRGG